MSSAIQVRCMVSKLLLEALNKNVAVVYRVCSTFLEVATYNTEYCYIFYHASTRLPNFGNACRNFYCMHVTLCIYCYAAGM